MHQRKKENAEMANEEKKAEMATAETADSNEGGETKDLGTINDEISSMRNHIAKLNEENKRHRLRAKEESEAKITALQENGEFKQLAKALQEKVEILEADLPSLREKAGAFDEFQEKESQRISQAISSVPENWREVIEGAPDLHTKRQILEVLQTTKQSQPQPQTQANAPSNNSQPSSAKEIAAAWMAKNSTKSGLFNR
tara:strand:- start:1674 stop:2270 length:597 start_codon:yes stop_codon:yes gene_type:complete